jgi:hypothetical protein
MQQRPSVLDFPRPHALPTLRATVLDVELVARIGQPSDQPVGQLEQQVLEGGAHEACLNEH